MTAGSPNAPAVRQEAAPVQAQTGEISAKFTADVIREYGSTIGAPQLSDYQRRLIQGYFIGIDAALAEAEAKRTYENRPPIWWQNVNMPALITDVVTYARMGLDMAQDNHLFAIPYYNERSHKYDVTLMPGYGGIAYIAMQYAAEPPAAVTTQLVYESDVFTPEMRAGTNGFDTYKFEIINPFNRGKLVGGFGYIEYNDPRKNRLIIMSKAAMDKRKPQKASGQFWGKWDDEMYLKTLYRYVYSSKFIPRDPRKIDDAYQRMRLREAQIAQMEASAEITQYANGEYIDTTPQEPAVINPPPVQTAAAPPAAVPEEPPAPPVSPVTPVTVDGGNIPALDF